jgi:hypothetical protein
MITIGQQLLKGVEPWNDILLRHPWHGKEILIKLSLVTLDRANGEQIFDTQFYFRQAAYITR